MVQVKEKLLTWGGNACDGATHLLPHLLRVTSPGLTATVWPKRKNSRCFYMATGSRFVMANMAAAPAQCIFGVGQVVGKLGMSAKMSPLMFYLVRVSLSGVIFLAYASMSKASLRIRRSDIPGFLMVRLQS